MSAASTPKDEEEPLTPQQLSRSFTYHGRIRSSRPSTQDLQAPPNERTSLLGRPLSPIPRSYSSPEVKPPGFTRTYGHQLGFRTPGRRTPGHRTPIPRHHTRGQSWGSKLASAMQVSWQRAGADRTSFGDMSMSKSSLLSDERVWYDQYTSTDWVRDSIEDNFRVRDLKAQKGIRGRAILMLDGAQGWILAAIVGLFTAFIAYFVDFTENAIFDIKEGYCTDGWHKSKGHCCLNEDDCPLWRTWGDVLALQGMERETADLLAYMIFVVLFSVVSCLMTLTTKTVVPSNISLPTMDENFGADTHVNGGDADTHGHHKNDHNVSPGQIIGKIPGPMVYYPAAGSGVAEVKVILSGFVVHGYLGFKTLIIKTLALILSVASGLSLGKEGPFVHIATCVGNIACRLFSKYRLNDGKRREVLSAAAASGVAVAFGAPIAGTLFSLEEVSYYFPPKTLFRTFFCCIAAALSLKFFNPYGTGKIVIFEVRYVTDWYFFEIIAFILLGVFGGALGAIFIKASRMWARSFRRLPMIKKMPLLEITIVALISGFLQFWNKLTKQAVTQLLYELASPCKDSSATSSSLCPADAEDIKVVMGTLVVAFIIKSFLTTITFGTKVPAGIYVPSMVVGGLMGRLVGHGIQYLTIVYPNHATWGECSLNGGPESCITPGVYALIAAGATMCGVTRLSVTLVVILFELTGSLDHVLPFSLSVLIAKWTADAIEPLSIYDLLTEMNHYPFLDNKTKPTFTSVLGDITPRVRSRRVIDISRSARVPISELRRKLAFLQAAGELDGGLPLIRDGVLVGLLPAPDLEFALDQLNKEEPTEAPLDGAVQGRDGAEGSKIEVLCLMSAEDPRGWSDEEEEEGDMPTKVVDITDCVDTAPIALDVHSPMDLVYQCFVKLGLRYICVSRNGHYAGMVHKKAFVKYIKDLEHGKAA